MPTGIWWPKVKVTFTSKPPEDIPLRLCDFKLKNPLRPEDEAIRWQDYSPGLCAQAAIQPSRLRMFHALIYPTAAASRHRRLICNKSAAMAELLLWTPLKNHCTNRGRAMRISGAVMTRCIWAVSTAHVWKAVVLWHCSHVTCLSAVVCTLLFNANIFMNQVQL